MQTKTVRKLKHVKSFPFLSTLLALFYGCAHTAYAGDPNRLTVVNHASTPVYAAAVTVQAEAIYQALGAEAGVPLEAVTDAGDILPLLPGQDDGGKVLRLFLSLEPGQKLELQLRQADGWAENGDVCSAAYDADTGGAVLENGVVRFVYREDRWSLSFSSPQNKAVAITPDYRQLLNSCRIDLWLDSERRGRLLGVADEKVREMGLIHSSDGIPAEGKATVNPDGSVSFTLKRKFADFAQDVRWTETYTLLPGRPVLTANLKLETNGGGKRYLAFVQHGGGMRGNFGILLHGKLRFGYQDPKEPNRLLLSGKENGALRIGWRGEKCWFAADSDIGSGVGISTTQAITRTIPGSRIWGLSTSGFFASFIDPEQENQPYAFCAEKPLDLGFAIVGSCGNVGIWHQTKQLFADVTAGKSPRISSSCAVYLNGLLLQPGEAPSFAYVSGTGSTLVPAEGGLQAGLAIDFQRPYNLSAQAEGATASNPIFIQLLPQNRPTKKIEALVLDQNDQRQVDLTALTGWMGKRQSFLLQVNQPPGSTLNSLLLEPAGFSAPTLDTPANGMSLTDLALFFRWKQVKGALDYEIQLARDQTFTAPITLSVRSEVEWPYYLPKDEELLTPGPWFWRVRAVEPERRGSWSVVRTISINSDHAKKPVELVISPERPLFTIEACRVQDLSKFKDTIPEDIKPFVAFNCHSKFNHLEYLKPLQEAGIKAFIRTHGPGVMSYWMPLADVEAVFQAYPNIIGIMGGETLSSHYHGGDNQMYINRLLKLCGKYGRIFYDADGTYPSENKWEALYSKEGALMQEYAGHIVFARKNNILHRQFVSQSSVLGLYLSDAILAQGAWEDGGWYWQQTGFRELGEIMGQRGGTVEMPLNFWNLNFLMGIASGCTVFSFEGQTGTMQVPTGYRIAEKGPYSRGTRAAHWTDEGELTPAFHRFMLPFIRGMIRHQLVPSKEQLLSNVKLGVYNDGVPKKENGDQYYYEWDALYRGTYGFRDVGVIPGTLMEFFPNTGRYFYFPVFPQGRVEIPEIELLPLSQFLDPAAVKAYFDQSYPAWYDGDALVTLVGDTLAVLNSNENLDLTESYRVPLKDRGIFAEIAGKIEPHAYVMGKFEDGNKRIWLQANAEYPERHTELTLTCARQPDVNVMPATGVVINQWNPSTKQLKLGLSHADGAVEVEINAAP